MNKHQSPVGHMGNGNRIPDLLKETKEALLSKIDESPRGRQRISVCPGCQAEEHGVKSRIAIPHICGR